LAWRACLVKVMQGFFKGVPTNNVSIYPISNQDSQWKSRSYRVSQKLYIPTNLYNKLGLSCAKLSKA